MLVAHTLGGNSTAPTMIRNVGVEIFAYLVFGVPQKMQEIMGNKFVE